MSVLATAALSQTEESQPAFEGATLPSNAVELRTALRETESCGEKGYEVSMNLVNNTNYHLRLIQAWFYNKDSEGNILDSGMDFIRGEASDLGIDPGRTGFGEHPLWSGCISDYSRSDLASYSVTVTYYTDPVHIDGDIDFDGDVDFDDFFILADNFGRVAEVESE